MKVLDSFSARSQTFSVDLFPVLPSLSTLWRWAGNLSAHILFLTESYLTSAFSFDELVVGAPMYTDIHLAAVERGRVYVFNNTRVRDGHWTGYNHVFNNHSTPPSCDHSSLHPRAILVQIV